LILIKDIARLGCFLLGVHSRRIRIRLEEKLE